MIFRPKYITFDCYGTLTYFPMHQVAYDIYEGQLPPEQMRLFIKDFSDYRFDEVLGNWKPYKQVIQSSLQRACKRQDRPEARAVMQRETHDAKHREEG